MTNQDDSRPYGDRCPHCRFATLLVEPAMVRENDRGTGVIADYLCPTGHAWSTGWAWWAGVRHATDGRAAA